MILLKHTLYLTISLVHWQRTTHNDAGKYISKFKQFFSLDPPSKTQDSDQLACSHCQKIAYGICTSCSQLVCEACAQRHQSRSKCHYFDLKDLRPAWKLLLERLACGPSNLATVLQQGVIGDPVRTTQVCPNLQAYERFMSDELKNYADWSSAGDFLRMKKNARVREIKKRTQAPIVATQTEDQKTRSQAEQVRLRWAFATTDKDRATCADKTQRFIQGEPIDIDENLQKQVKANAHKLMMSKRPTPNDSSVSEDILANFYAFARFSCLLQQGNCFATIAHPSYDQYITMHPDAPDKIKNKKVKLWWIDPMYGDNDQPTPQEFENLRKTFDRMSQVGSVFVIWGRVHNLYEKWKPIFKDGYSGSKATYYVDPSPFVLVRDPLKDKHTRNNKTLHSMTEHALVVTMKSLSVYCF